MICLTIACGDYDRIRPIWDGSVSAEDLDMNVLLLPIEEIFFRMARYQEFDAAEMSLSSFLISKSRGAPRFVAIPIFPSRKFRHGDVYIRNDSKIKKPEDLRNVKIGVPEYQITAAVWVRGILQEFYNVPATKVHWFTGGTERPGREERLKITFTAKEVEVIADNGARTNYGLAVLATACYRVDNLYRIHNTRAKGFLVYTNNVPKGAMRGFGNPEMLFAVESLFDMLAEDAGIDSGELRLKNTCKT